MRAIVTSETQADWFRFNPVLADGEVVFEKDTKRFKVGDGKSKYRDLEYVTDPMLGFYFGEILFTKSAAFLGFVYSFMVMAIPTIFWDKFKNLPTLYIIGIFFTIYFLFYRLLFNRMRKRYYE